MRRFIKINYKVTMDRFDIYKSYVNLFENVMDDSFHVVENRVPIKHQLEYFKASGEMKDDMIEVDDADIDLYEAKLNSPETPIEEKKHILLVLGVSKNIRGYRLLENYQKHPDEELKHWSFMAMMESRVALESEFTGEKQIYVSTGMGGKGNKLRFYGLFMSEDYTPLLDYQQDIIIKEFNYMLPKYNCEVESINIKGNYFDMVFLMPMRTNIRETLNRVVEECNQYGNFLSDLFIVTNLKEINPSEAVKIVALYEKIFKPRFDD